MTLGNQFFYQAIALVFEKLIMPKLPWQVQNLLNGIFPPFKNFSYSELTVQVMPPPENCEACNNCDSIIIHTLDGEICASFWRN